MDDPGILLVGCHGMLGTAWRAELERRAEAFRAVDYPEIDLSSEASVARVLDRPYRYVINCAAYTDVDGAEAHEEAANEINGQGARRLADACRVHGSVLLHYSTDYVFDGVASAPYRTDAPLAPQNVYGRSKALGEQLIEASGCEYLIVRTSWLYAPWAKNFVRTIAGLCRTRDSLRVVDDQRGRPTSAESLARISARLLEHLVASLPRPGGSSTSERSRGSLRRVLHATDGGECTWWDLASFIAERVNPRTTIERCTTAEFPRPAKRPSYSVLDVTETEALVGPLPSWQTEVASVLGRLDSV